VNFEISGFDCSLHTAETVSLATNSFIHTRSNSFGSRSSALYRVGLSTAATETNNQCLQAAVDWNLETKVKKNKQKMKIDTKTKAGKRTLIKNILPTIHVRAEIIS